MRVNIVEGRKALKISDNPKLLVDVFRSTTTIPLMLKSGALKVIPFSSIKEAKLLKKKDPSVILSGERYGFKIPGFQMSNSPYEANHTDLKGKIVAFTSTNGTKVLKRIEHNGPIYIGSFVNFTATIDQLKQFDEIDIFMSGRPDGTADEDFYFAQAVETYFQNGEVNLNDFIEKVRNSNGSKRLKMIGQGRDIDEALTPNIVNFPVIFVDGEIIKK
ncbi:2-phosphosulfolactate phosphatase [Caldiplasma sukawensis]